MGKKYLNTKKGSIEQSILDVWQEAAEMHAEGMDGRTKEYRSHRGKLESNRVRRETKKSSVKTELPETQHGSGEHAYEVGTDRYAEYTAKITPGQMNETVQEMLYDWLWNLPDKDFNDLLEAMSDEEIIALDEGIGSFIQKHTGLGFGGKSKRAAHLKKKAKKAKEKTSAIQDIDKYKQDIRKSKQDRKDYKKDQKAKKSGGDDDYVPGETSDAGKAKKAQDAKDADAKKAQDAKDAKDAKDATDTGDKDAKDATDTGDKDDKELTPAQKADAEKKRKKKNGAGEDTAATENINLRATIKNLWIEAAAAAVDPKEREELDLAPEDTAKKMKRAKEPAPNVSESFLRIAAALGEGTKEEYQKFFQGALKKFKIKSPAELKSDEEKKKFFDYVDKNYTGEKDEEKIEEKIELAKEFKVSSMRHALEKVWSVAEGELPPALKKAIDAKKKDKEEDEDYHDDDDDDKKKGNTMTGKKKAAVDVNPHQSSRYR